MDKEDKNKQQENAFVIYGELIRFLKSKSSELKLDMYARATAHINITPESVTEIIDNIKNVLDVYKKRVNLDYDTE